MFTWKRLLFAGIAACVLLIGFVSLILPGIVIDQVQEWVTKETGRTLKIGDLSINIFGLDVTVRDLSLSDVDPEQVFIAWQELHVSLDLASIYYLAPVIDELRLEDPRIHLERLADNRFNFSDLIPTSAPQQAPEPEKGAMRFSINNLLINNGEIELVDRTFEEEIHHHIRKLHLALPALGNLPYMVDNPIQPLLQAEINDAPLEIKGEAKPFTKALEMRFAIELSNIDLPAYLAYIPAELPFRMNNGLLNLDLDLLYKATTEAAPELELNGHVYLATVDIADRQGAPLFFLPLLQMDIAPSHPLARNIHLTSLRVYNLEVQLQRDRQGVWNHSRLRMKDGQPADSEPAAKEPSEPLQLVVDDIEVRDGVVVFRDEVPYSGFQTTVREINIDVERFALTATEPSPVRLSLETDWKESVAVQGHFLLDPFTLALQADLRNLLVAAYEPYYRETYAGPLGGAISAQLQLDINPVQPLLVSHGKLQWQDAYMAFNDQEGMGCDRLDVDDLNFDLAKNRLDIASARYINGRVSFSRDTDGQWSFFSRRFPILAKLTETPDQEPAPPVKQEGPEFSYRVEEFSVNNWEFDIYDRMPTDPVHLQIHDFNLTFRNLAAPEKVVSSIELQTGFQHQGSIQAKGTASLAEQTLDLKSRLSNIPLTIFAPYVADQTNLILEGGRFNATLGSWLAAGEHTEGTINGDIGISRFHVLDGTHREDLLKWDSLQIAKLTGRTNPLTLDIESITLSDYFVKLLIDEQQRLNLVEAFHKSPTDTDNAEQPKPEKPASDAGTESGESGSRHHFRIDTVVLQGGEVDFTDRSLPRTFHADMTELGGRVTGLDSDPESRADLDLRGSLRNQSPLEISGTLNPLIELPYLDLKLSFRNIEMSPMSPYSGTYVGYLIDKGKLNLALEYQLEDNQLRASNEIFLDQFTFGEPVESDKATGLPVKMAVALLKDRNGEIHLDIPVTGNLEDPQFSVGGVIWKVIRNLLVKAATSPLALLGALVGGGDEDFSSVHFAYGSARLPAPEQEKLDKIAQALEDRPSLDLEIKGYIDPDNDPEGYRREKLRLRIHRLKYLELLDKGQLEEGVSENTIEVSPEEYPDYLWEVYKSMDFPKPRNFIGMTKKLPPEEQEKLIYANTPVGETELADLAQARAQAVQSYLVGHGGLDPSRVFLIRPESLTPPDEGDTARSRVDFGLNVP